MTTTFKRNVRESFGLVKKDIYNLNDHIKYIYSQIEQLKAKNSALETELKYLKPKREESKKVVASRTAQKIHDVKCAFAKKIKAKNKVTFPTKNEALVQGFTACDCLAVA